ncbi:MAG: RluA family pseudouridine synthase [Candidatus Omnitrophota bacterium]|nr:MAG: RluA family pseudouridine synthase [Candidatus Omnitrophota bacterium]
MQELKFEVDSGHAGKRLDKFLVEILKGTLSRSFIKKLIDGRKVSVNEKYTNAHHKIFSGEIVKITIPEPEPLELKPENIPLDIVYEDKDLVVLNKPVGISTHPAGRHLTGTLVNALLYRVKDLSGIGGVSRPGIVHRLDKETSGLLVVAKNDNSHINLSNQFKNRTIRRKYIALVKGIVQLDNGRIELPIARRKKDITKMCVSFASEKKRNAVTNYKVLKRFKDFTELSLSLETGRTHQIRVHLAHMGHPVVGDKLYGSSRGMNRQALHAKTLGFFHPTTKKFMEFDSELPRDMQQLIEKGKL